jgi:hypothetical protein
MPSHQSVRRHFCSRPIPCRLGTGYGIGVYPKIAVFWKDIRRAMSLIVRRSLSGHLIYTAGYDLNITGESP